MKKLIKRIRKVFAKKTRRLDRRQMWFLDGSEAELRAHRDLKPEVLDALVSLRDNGFAVLKNNVPHALCDAVVEDFRRYCAATPEAAAYRDEHGLHSRLALFHQVSDNALSIAALPRTTELLRAAFRSEFNVVGSLLFEKGSAQDVHRDTPAFFTNPLNHFFGVWNALEDVREGSGELCYYRGGHKVARDADLYGDPATTMDAYFPKVEAACKAAGLELERFTPNKGDTLLWLPELPHGGSPRRDPRASRRSIVFHCLPAGTPIHGVKEFFNPGRPLFVNENYSVTVRNGVRMLDLGPPKFFHNYKEGNFDEI